MPVVEARLDEEFRIVVVVVDLVVFLLHMVQRLHLLHPLFVLLKDLFDWLWLDVEFVLDVVGRDVFIWYRVRSHA